jgi:RNA polymerase sigma-70 factor (ECF subfamily)
MTSTSDSQKGLLEQARQGSADAFAALFEQYRPMLTAVASRLAGAADGDDVVMETYLKAWSGLARFGGRAALSTWLCRIVRNCALDICRRQGRENRRRVDSVTAEGADIFANLPDERAGDARRHAETQELGVAVRRAMAKLSENHCTVILLREVDGLSYGEIAAATGASIGTVMSRLFHARFLLRKHIERMGICQA